LIEDTINGVFDKSIDAKTANAVGMLTGYGLNALREARGGKMKMSVFLRDMRAVKVEMMSTEDMDRFLQGDENVQIEVLQQLEEKGGVIEAGVAMTAKQEIKPKLDVPLIAQMTGIDKADVKDALSGEGEKPVIKHKLHEWAKTLAGNTRFCLGCGEERERLQPEDASSACPGDWGTS
jgi:hypothetical protein